MIGTVHKTTRWLTVMLIVLVAALAVVAEAQAKPIKELISSRIGWEVNKDGAGICTRAEEGEGKCQPGKLSTAPGGFEFVQGVAVNNDPASAQHGDLYVFDTTHRVQVLSATGQFVSFFGWDVNKTKVQKGGATQQEMNVCTETEVTAGAECQPGATGTSPGQFNEIQSIAVDPASGNVYVAETIEDFTSKRAGGRVQELTGEGRFLLEIGREVNETTKGNLCTADEELKGAKCVGPAMQGFSAANAPTKERDAFSLDLSQDSVSRAGRLRVGGPEDLVYVGEAGRVQELQADGTYKGEIPLPPEVTVPSIGVDSSGNVFIPPLGVGVPTNEIERFDPSGKETGRFEIAPRRSNGLIQIFALATDPAGRLAVVDSEEYFDPKSGFGTAYIYRGQIYNPGAERLQPVSEFIDPVRPEALVNEGITDVAFNDKDAMYATDFGPDRNEVVAYAPVTVGEPLTGAATCVPGAESETDATFDCSLNGGIDPWGVPDTEAWFQWGLTPAFGQSTPKQAICQTGCGEAPVALAVGIVKGLLPNQPFYWRVGAEDADVVSPELLSGEQRERRTPTAAPRVVGEPVASLVKSFSADLFGEVNPENASSEYFFEYAPQAREGETLASRCPNGVRKEACAGVATSKALRSGEYRRLATTIEANDLQPNTSYRYRLTAVNETGERALYIDERGKPDSGEGAFTTAPAPVPQALTGAASAVTATSALVSGTVNPDGQRAIYAFELGVYRGASTQYGRVLSAPAGEGATPVSETEQLSGLQPGTTYAYRILVASAYGTSYGAPVTFTTMGLPAVLALPVSLELLPVPAIRFPPETQTTPRAVKCGGGYTRGKHGKCVKAKHRKRARRARRARGGGHTRGKGARANGR